MCFGSTSKLSQAGTNCIPTNGVALEHPGPLPFSACSDPAYVSRIFHLRAWPPSGFGYLSRRRGSRHRCPRLRSPCLAFSSRQRFWGSRALAVSPECHSLAVTSHGCLPAVALASTVSLLWRWFPSPASLNVPDVSTPSTSSAVRSSLFGPFRALKVPF